MGLIGCAETSIRNYHYPLRINPEDRISLRTFSSQIVMKCTFSPSVGVQRALVGSKQNEKRMYSTHATRKMSRTSQSFVSVCVLGLWM
jgi:hypothetical protein